MYDYECRIGDPFVDSNGDMFTGGEVRHVPYTETTTVIRLYPPGRLVVGRDCFPCPPKPGGNCWNECREPVGLETFARLENDFSSFSGPMATTVFCTPANHPRYGKLRWIKTPAKPIEEPAKPNATFENCSIATPKVLSAETWPKGLVLIRHYSWPTGCRVTPDVWLHGVRFIDSNGQGKFETYNDVLNYYELSLDGGITWKRVGDL